MAKKNVQHTNRKHALLSASGSSMWLNCTPSARLAEKFEESKSSVYAQEGTLAHEFGDITLRHRSKQLDTKTFDSEIRKLRKEKLYTSEMEPEVDKYVDYVMERFAIAKSKTPGALLIVEERLDYSHIVEMGFGTGDALIVADDEIEVIDLKYGKGVKVDATDNSQLKLYGIGALRAFELSYDINNVILTVVQPRLDHVSNWETPVPKLLDWAENTVKKKAAVAYKGGGLQKAGSWCKWCKVKPMCATLASQNLKLAKHEFKDPHLLSKDQLIQVFEQQPMLVDWVKSCSEYILKETLEGRKFPGYKVVEGRSQRKLVNPPGIIKTLIEKGFKQKDFTSVSLAGIGVIEKLVGKTKINTVLGEFIIKPPGKPALVRDSDNRPAMGFEQAKNDFKD